MPIYEFTCKKCERNTEIMLPISKKDENNYCNYCGAILYRKISPVPIHYKCDGFYCTDNKKD